MTNESALEIVKIAESLITDRYIYGKHHIACVLKTKSGRIFSAIHIDANVRRAAICAESIVLGQAILANIKDAEVLVSVRHSRPDEPQKYTEIVSPCGICREILADYYPKLTVLIQNGHEIVRIPVFKLLPHKFNHA